MPKYKNICIGAIGFCPSPDQEKQTKSEWLEQFLANSAEYNKMSADEVREYMGDSYECTDI